MLHLPNFTSTILIGGNNIPLPGQGFHTGEGYMEIHRQATIDLAVRTRCLYLADFLNVMFSCGFGAQNYVGGITIYLFSSLASKDCLYILSLKVRKPLLFLGYTGDSRPTLVPFSYSGGN